MSSPLRSKLTGKAQPRAGQSRSTDKPTAPANAKTVKRVSSAPHQVRIVGGQWKRTLIRVIDAEGLRPTPDRVRETLFNWLGQDLSGWQCLDLFAGSGALGFEAASRGAQEVILVENHKTAFAQLQALQEKLQAQQVRLIAGDALGYLQTAQRRASQFDLIFLDPPFHADWLPRVLPQITACLKPKGLLYVESEAVVNGQEPWCQAYQIVRQGKAGMAHFALLTHQPTTIAEGAASAP
ncbi:16S rRNA (guanine(966)-N(2))-methyltransferase RsmD [Ampullimonas aquatilis]|uniref:16S rRNA (guanine(966)-N(2))-methyltransferase RsmD n=1 Tax=Ampullimonas aquatilis TaxID=1341549 RepID=UPI003C70D8B4